PVCRHPIELVPPAWPQGQSLLSERAPVLLLELLPDIFLDGVREGPRVSHGWDSVSLPCRDAVNSLGGLVPQRTFRPADCALSGPGRGFTGGKRDGFLRGVPRTSHPPPPLDRNSGSTP